MSTMSAENVQRQHLEELRKERSSQARTPPLHSFGPETKKRTARKSTHSGRVSSVDTDTLLGKDDENSTASDASRDSRTSELGVKANSNESVLEKPAGKPVIAKELGESKVVPTIICDDVKTLKGTKKSDATDAVVILRDGDSENGTAIGSPTVSQSVDESDNVVDEKDSKVAADKEVSVNESETKVAIDNPSEILSKDTLFDGFREGMPPAPTSEDVLVGKMAENDDNESSDSIFNKLVGDISLKLSSADVSPEGTVQMGEHETSESIFNKFIGDISLKTTSEGVTPGKMIQKDDPKNSDSIFSKLIGDISSLKASEDVTANKMVKKDEQETSDSIFDKLIGDIGLSVKTTSEDVTTDKAVPKDDHEALNSTIVKGDKPLETASKNAVEGKTLETDSMETSESVFDKLVKDESSSKTTTEDTVADKTPETSDSAFIEDNAPPVTTSKDATTVPKDGHESLDSIANKFEDSSSEAFRENKSAKAVPKDTQSDKLLKSAFFNKLREDVISDLKEGLQDKKAEDVVNENLEDISNSEIEDSSKDGEGDALEKQSAAPEDMKKVWENIRKDLTLTGDSENPVEKEEEEDLTAMEELPFGESLPQTEEEPSDWEEWEENSEHEQQEDADQPPADPPTVGECVVISSDEDNSRDSQTGVRGKGAKRVIAEVPIVESKKAEETLTVEKSLPVPSSNVSEDGDNISEADTGCSEKLRLSEMSDIEDPPAKRSKTEPSAEEIVAEAADSEKKNEEEKLEVSVEIVEPEKEEERPGSPDIRLEMECVPEEVTPASDDPTIIVEKKAGKRSVDDVNAAGDSEEKSDAKKVKLEAEVKEDIKPSVKVEDVKPNILSHKILEELISRKIKDFMMDGNRSAFSALKERCDSLEKSVERWKLRAQHLQNQLNELVLEQKRYNARKTKVPTRTVGINVRMVQQVVPPSVSVTKLPPPVSTPSSMSGAKDKPPTARAGPVPLQLIANMASPAKSSSVLAPSTQTAAKAVSVTSAPASVKIIDLTQDEEHAAAQKTAASLPAGTTIRPSMTIQPSSVVSVPVVQGGVSSVMQLIPTSAASLTTGVRLPSAPTMTPGARVTYLVPNTIGGPRQLMAFPQQNIQLQGVQGARPPMQTILLRMNTVPQSGATTAQFVTTTPTNSTISLVPSPAAPVRAPTPAQTFIRTPATVTATTDTTTTQSTAPVNTLVISCLQKHPAPLPISVTYPEDPKLKSLPPRPALKISKVAHGIVLSWNMTVNAIHADISVYQLYAYQETNGPPSSSLWKKVGDVRALPLPMACTLTQFVQGHKYHFAVRAVDAHNRLGPFSEPTSIVLHSK